MPFPVVPGNAESLKVEALKEPGSTQATGYYTVTIAKTDGTQEKVVVSGQIMVLMLGAFVSQKMEQTVFAPLMLEVEKKNDIIDAYNALIPILVGMQNKVPSSGSYELQEPEKSIWIKNAKFLHDQTPSLLPTPHTDATFNSTDISELLSILPTGLTAQTQAREQTMMEINTKASLRLTFFNLMQSNASAFKQSSDTAARG